ncbi:class I adenylate-forming enzyme family protein [Actinomadura sp. GTD37]|uniref:class I adenylate-forming enzyme family protein n=1 Tax=Actinomadura sp. GTD37 TaxID=1778030 RepID=UPI0035C0FC5E
MAGISIARRILDLAGDRPGRVVLRHLGPDGAETAFTWPDLERRSGRLAGALAARGLGAGDRLGLALRNSPEFTLSALAAWRLGAVPVPVRWDVPGWELGRLREVIEPKVHLGADDLGWIDAAADLDPPELPDVVSPHLNGICSSGSTGLPKVILSERPGLFDPALGAPIMALWAPVPRPQRVLVLAPMYHANGFSALFSLLAGDELVVLGGFDAARAADAVERHRISTFTATPTMLQRIADLPGIDGRDLSSLRFVLQGAAPMPPSLVHRWAGLIGAERLVMAYGMTEGLGITALRGDEWMTHRGSVGRGLRDTELRVLGTSGEPVPAGEIGEVYLRSPAYRGYRYVGGAPRLKGTEDGFQTAGDMGYLDGEGYLYLIDRRVDMIVTGGANVFPAEVEAALIDHPAIADVVVIGLRDAEWGRRVHAVIEPADPAAPPAHHEVVAYAKARLAPYKVPKTTEIVDAVPRSAATKVNRGALVEARGG